MSDGNMAIQVGPVSEEDMGKVREMFQRVLDTVAQATTLATEVAKLRRDVEDFRTEVEHWRGRFQESDRLLHDVRRQRDDAYSEAHRMREEKEKAESELANLTAASADKDARIAELESTLRSVREQFDNTTARLHNTLVEIKTLQDDNNRLQHDLRVTDEARVDLQERLKEAKRERDNYGFEVMEKTDEAARWKARAEQARKLLADMSSVLAEEQPKQEPPQQPHSDWR